MAEVCLKCGSKSSGNVCSKCGLPVDLCVCATIEREVQKIKIFLEKRKFGKPITIIEGITDNAKDLASQLKAKLACGGTFKNNRIELQGDHLNKLKDILVKLGYSEDQIELS
jgi:translation initiation factor 1